MKVLLFGGAGQLGTDIVESCPPAVDLVIPGHGECDISNIVDVKTMMDRFDPDVVINAAAFNLTDQCEIDPDMSFRVNAEGPRIMASLAKSRGARFLHFSTDYVFDGAKTTPYTESDYPEPLNQYGKTKLAGERHVMAESSDFVILRTSSLFGRAGSRGMGGNFVENIVRRARSGETLRVVDDVSMSPTYTLDLAERCWQMIDRKVPGGVYHVTNDGYCTWYEFAVEILRAAGEGAEVVPIGSYQWPAKFMRPKFSALSSERFSVFGFPKMRHWRDALSSYFSEKKVPQEVLA